MKRPSRFDYVRYDEQAHSEQMTAKDLVLNLEMFIVNLDPKSGNDYTKEAIKKLEECYMYIGKLVRDNQIIRNGSAPLEEYRGEREEEAKEGEAKEGEAPVKSFLDENGELRSEFRSEFQSELKSNYDTEGGANDE